MNNICRKKSKKVARKKIKREERQVGILHPYMHKIITIWMNEQKKVFNYLPQDWLHHVQCKQAVLRDL